MAASEGRGALSVECTDPVEAAGANDPVQLAELEAAWRRRTTHALLHGDICRSELLVEIDGWRYA
jgi:bifunctional UDP-N-acetylglucosamine pyrophosphorylase/glucosamine-1-phosphate N-acetyltransferase